MVPTTIRRLVRRRPLRAAALAAAAWLAACTNAGQAGPDRADAAGATPQAVSVVSNGWHTGIVVARDEVTRRGRIPEAADFPDAIYLEFGWGDREYYPEPRPTVGMALSAALTPTDSVVHLAGLSQSVARAHAEVDVVHMQLTEAELDRLIAALDATFERGGAPRAQAVAPGLYSNSHFYPARGRFHLFNNCNTWVARTLAEAGLDLPRSGVIRAAEVMERLRALPRVSSER